jgi:plasmid stabilization system protein ParE
MKYRVVMSQSALDQIASVYRWIAKRAPVTANRWYAKLKKTLESLDSLPDRCLLSPEGELFQLPVKQLLYGKPRKAYRILFYQSENTVTVLNIIHGSHQFLSITEITQLLKEAE